MINRGDEDGGRDGKDFFPYKTRVETTSLAEGEQCFGNYSMKCWRNHLTRKLAISPFKHNNEKNNSSQSGQW